MKYRKFRITGWVDFPEAPLRFTVHGLTGRLWWRKWHVIGTASDLASAEQMVKRSADYPHMDTQRDYTSTGERYSLGGW